MERSNAMPSEPKTILPHTRRAKIRQLLNDRGSAGIVELARMFGVSEMTVRRDLAALAEDGQIMRTHGGAVATEKMVFEFDFGARRAANRPAKRAIARKAMEFVKPGQIIILDTGTTTLELAHLLRQHEDITVLTPSLAVASELQFSEGIHTVLLGGLVRKGSPDLTGAVTEGNLDLFAADIAFQGADGIDLSGRLYNADLQIAHVDRKMRERAAHTYILCDSSKIGKNALACNGTLKEVDALITDDGIRPSDRKKLQRTGATVIVARCDS